MPFAKNLSNDKLSAVKMINGGYFEKLTVLSGRLSTLGQSCIYLVEIGNLRSKLTKMIVNVKTNML